MERQYKLRCTAIGHESDVRSVCVTNYPEGAILSGSRDVTARIWVPNQCVFDAKSALISVVCWRWPLPAILPAVSVTDTVSLTVSVSVTVIEG